MNVTTTLLTLLVITTIANIDGKKLSKSRSSARGSSRKTNYNPQPVPTSLSYPQPSAPKPSLFGWQEKPVQKTQTSSRQSKPTSSQSHSYPSSNTGLSGNNNQPIQSQSKPTGNQGHSYPSSNTGLSGNNPSKQLPTHQDSIQKSNAPNTYANSQQSHSYPSNVGSAGSSNYPKTLQQGSGLSGSSGATYPQQHGGLSGSGAYPQQHGSGVAPPPYPGYSANRPPSGGSNPYNNNGGNYYHPQGPQPSYTNYGPGYGGHGFNNPGPQAPGYFGNYVNNRGFGSVGSRSRSALTGVGIAGAGVGTLLTGLALWNLARSTGHHHHTVIYDNRGQPVAVQPVNSTTTVVDPMLADLVNCTLTISGENATEVLAIPCAIATSFTPDADVKDDNSGIIANDNTKCIVTVLTKSGKEYMTTISCAILLNTAAENNVTEAPMIANTTKIIDSFNTSQSNSSDINQSTALKFTGTDDSTTNRNLDCIPQPGDVRDPLNPCYSVTYNLTVIPLQVTNKPSSDV